LLLFEFKLIINLDLYVEANILCILFVIGCAPPPKKKKKILRVRSYANEKYFISILIVLLCEDEQEENYTPLCPYILQKCPVS